MPVTHTRSAHRRKSGHGTTIAIVVGLHVVMGAALIWIATTETGQRIYKEYRVKFYQPPKKEEPREEAKKEEPPPPKPEPKKAEEETPEAPVTRAEESAPSEEMKLGGDSGDPFGGGPGKAIDVQQAYYLSVTAQLRARSSASAVFRGPNTGRSPVTSSMPICAREASHNWRASSGTCGAR